MAGTLFGLGLSQAIGSDGRPLGGWKLSIYEPTTSTPVAVYKDTGLTAGQEHPHPIVADANGRMPAFWVADGTYRARGTDSAASLILFDEDNLLAIGPSSGEGGGGGGVDANALLVTGDFIWSPKSGTRAGFVRANGRTIGSATSGAAERANADTEDLFTDLWNNYSDTLCPVTTGRGANAAADWAANKPIATLDLRGKAPFGLADMGNSDSGILDDVTFDVGNKTTAASQGGDALHTLTTGESGQKAISAAPVTVTDPTHQHNVGYNQNTIVITDGVAATGLHTVGTKLTNAVATGITAAFTLAGSSAVSAHNNMPPFAIGTFYIKL